MLTRIRLTYKQNRFGDHRHRRHMPGSGGRGLHRSLATQLAERPMALLPDLAGRGYNGGPIPDAAQLRCNALVQSYQNLQQSTDVSIVRMLLWFYLSLPGIILGATPLVAGRSSKERPRFVVTFRRPPADGLLGRILAGVLLIVPLMLALGDLRNILQAQCHRICTLTPRSKTMPVEGHRRLLGPGPRMPGVALGRSWAGRCPP